MLSIGEHGQVNDFLTSNIFYFIFNFILYYNIMQYVSSIKSLLFLLFNYLKTNVT